MSSHFVCVCVCVCMCVCVCPHCDTLTIVLSVQCDPDVC